MMYNKEYCKELLLKNIVEFNFTSPYTFASGIESYMYCDNRKLLAMLKIRKRITESLSHIAITLNHQDKQSWEAAGYVHNMLHAPIDRESQIDIVVGVATAGIPWASLCAYNLNKPLSYVRTTTKQYGKQSQIEGADIRQKHIIVIEDVLSTASSALATVEACRKVGAKVEAVLSLFTYNFKEKKKRFEDAQCSYVCISSFEILASTALELQHIKEEQHSLLLDWQSKH